MATIKKEVRLGCPLSSLFYNIHNDDSIEKWQIHLESQFRVVNIFFYIILFADDKF